MNDIQNGILNVLRENAFPLNIHVEYLEARRIDIKRIQDDLADYLAIKYKDVIFDVIIACDNAAIEFVKTFRRRLFPGVPVAFCGLSYSEGASVTGSRDFIGVTEEIAMVQTMELALSLHPKTKRIFVFSDDISVYVPSTPATLTRMSRIEQRVNVEVLEGLRLDQAAARMSDFPADSLVILINIGRGADGRHVSCEKVAEILSASRPIPIYACWDFYLGHGVVGGRMINGFSQGRAAARIALKMLKKNLPADFPRVQKGATAFMFDQVQMARFGLVPSMLPPNSRIINKPPSFYERHKKLFQVSLGSSIVLFLTAVLLTMSLIKTRKIQKSLTISEQKAKALFNAIPDAMFCIDKKGVFHEFKASPQQLCRRNFDLKAGQTLNQTLPEPFVNKVMKYISLTLFENQMQTFEYELETSDKGRRRFEARMVPSGPDAVMSIVRDVTKKKEAEEQIRQSEQKLHRLIQSLPIGIVVHGSDTAVLDFNIAALELLGLTPHKLMGKKADDPVWHFIREDKVRLTKDQYPANRVLKTGRSLKNEISGIIRPDSKEPVWAMINAVPGRNARGDVSEVIVSFSDMTDRKKAMEKLWASQKRYQSIYQGTPLYATTWLYQDGDFFLLDANQAANKSSNHAIQKHLGEKASVFFKDSPWVLAAVRQCHARKVPIEEQGRLRTRSTGEEKYFRLFINSIPPDMVLVLAQDLTENTRTREALTRRETQFRVLFEQAIDAILFLDGKGKVLDANRTALGLFGGNKTRMVMRSIFDLVPRDSRFHLARLVDEKPKILEIPELFLQKQNGVVFPGSMRSFRSTVQGETVIFLFIRDLTAQKAQEQKKQKLKAQLTRARKMESIGNLAGGIAHDFNNILSSIIGYTELAIEDAEKGSMLEDDLQEIYLAGKRARDLIRQILAFARQSDEHLVPVRASSIVKEAMNLIRSSIPSSIEISLNIQSDDLIMGLPTQVHQLVINLCTNAAHAMTDETGVLGVTLKKVHLDERFTAAYVDLAAGRYLELSVSDTGTGISPELKEAIFEPYFTTKKPGEGTGMGLATVHGIVKRYGGEITVDSRVGKGSVFHVFLPVTKRRPEEEQPSVAAPPTGTERILLVDDERAIVKMGNKALSRLGYKVFTRTDSRGALALFTKRPHDFDLVITDMTMPGLTGEKLAMEIHRIRPDIPIIICTGYSTRINGEIAARAGIAAVFHKPIIKSDLARVVRNALDAVSN